MAGLSWCILVDLFNHMISSANPIQVAGTAYGAACYYLARPVAGLYAAQYLFGWRELLKRRRALGLYAFMYVTIHVIIFVDLDYGLAWSFICKQLSRSPHIDGWPAHLPDADTSGVDLIRYLEETARQELETPAQVGLSHRPAGCPALCLGQKG